MEYKILFEKENYIRINVSHRYICVSTKKSPYRMRCFDLISESLNRDMNSH